MNIQTLKAELDRVGYKNTPWTPAEIKKFKDQYQGRQLPKDFVDLITQLGYVAFNTTYNSNGQIKPTTEELTLPVWKTS